VDLFVSSGRAFEQSQLQRRVRQLIAVSPEAEADFASPEDIILVKLEWFQIGNYASAYQWPDVRAMLLVQAGDLVLPSGRIIATDPCYLRTLGDTPPFVQTVRPRRYPVWLAMTRLEGPLQGERVACAVLQLTEAPAVRWELALRTTHKRLRSAGALW
jgi:hypothetical protein